ncbi:hypothetical protein [Microbispora rosea]|uniref:hypothetical protein n=1 Tax=Microbispora rosea TaxID=58117 RepID=UPI0004C3EC43|nr:hypothetical protein [Microbispora rosea]
MTETPMDGTPPRNGRDARDWFAPPAEQPSDITYSGPLPAPIPTAPPSVPIPGTLKPPTDLRVWPPLEPEGEDRSTQPFPALRTNRQPPPAALAPVPPSPEPPAEPPAEVPAEEPTAPKRRTGLLVGGTVLSVVLAAGAPTVFGYQAYKYGRPDDTVQVVQPGQAAVWQHVSWRATVEKIKDPTGKPERSDRQWLKVVATRTALDAEGAIRHGEPAEVRFTDRAGRTWQLEMVNNETPPDVKDNKIGTPYRLEMMGVVPPSLAGEVEVVLRPSTYRDVPDQSAEDFVKAAFTSQEKNDRVLRFRR